MSEIHRIGAEKRPNWKAKILMRNENVVPSHREIKKKMQSLRKEIATLKGNKKRIILAPCA